MLRWRLLSAAIMIAIMLGLVALDAYTSSASGIWLYLLGLVAAVLATSEMVDLLRATHPDLGVPVALAGPLLVFGASGVPILWQAWAGRYPADCPVGRAGWPLLGLSLALGWVFAREMLLFRLPGTPATVPPAEPAPPAERALPTEHFSPVGTAPLAGTEALKRTAPRAVAGELPGATVIRIAVQCLVLVYPSLLLAYATLLRQWHSHLWGLAILISVIAIVKLSDTGAYFGGRALGKRKLAVRLSPGKTVAGAVCGLASAAVAAWIYFRWIVPSCFGLPGDQLATIPLVAYGLVVGVAGMFGDLAESLLKRDLSRKDSSGWLPGLGGILDTMDSLLAAAPAAYACWLVELLQVPSEL